MEAQYPYDGRQLCAKEDPEVFFPEDYNDRLAVNVAKDICRACPLQISCAEYAIPQPYLDGVWGATTPRERSRLRAKRKQRAYATH